VSVTNSDRESSDRETSWATVETDAHGVVTSWSAGAEAITGLTAAEMVGQPAWEICTRMLPPGDDPEAVRRRVKLMVEKALSPGNPGGSEDTARFHLRRTDGNLRTIEHILSVVDSDGRRVLRSQVRDVTESDRRPAQDDDRYRQLFQENLSGMAVHQIIRDDAGNPVDYRFVEVNPAFERITGRSRDDIEGKTGRELEPELEPVWIERFGRIAQTGIAEQFEQYNPHLRRNYIVRAFRSSPDHVVVAFQDVTAVHERTSFAETIISSAGEGIVVFDRDLRYVVFNPVMERISGLEAGSVLGRRPGEIFSTELGLLVTEACRRALAGETIAGRDVQFTIQATGAVHWADASFHPHRDSRGEIVGVVATVIDVTARHEALMALAQSEDEFRTIFDNVGDGVAISDLDGRFVEVNRVVCERLGYTREELLGMGVRDMTTPELAAQFAERTASICSGGVHVFESTHVRKDGTQIPIEAVARRIDFRGSPAVLTVHRDIADRKRSEMAIRQQALFLQQLIDAIPIPITAKTRDGRIALCNDAFTKGPGLPRSQTVGKTITELGRTGAGLHEKLDREVLKTGVSKQFEDWMGFDDGTKRRLVLTKAAIKAEDGSTTGIVTTTLDITERYLAEQALKLSEERFRMLFEHAGDAMFITDLAGRVLEVNQTACDRLGYSRDEFRSMPEALRDEPGYPAPSTANTAAVVASGHLVFETTLKRRDGTEMPVDINAVGIKLGDTDAILTIARDITEHRRAERERALLEEQLLQSQKMEGIGRLAGGIAHDFNNLLTAIRGNASLALVDLPPGSAAKDDLEQIVESSDRAAALTRQLLAFARRTVMQPVVVDLGSTMKRLEPMLKRLLGEDIALVTVSSTGAFVLADPSQIEQVIVNLAVNAADAMPKGGTLAITVSTHDVADINGSTAGEGLVAGRTARLTVRDTGSGMDEATLERIFEPFFTTKGPGKGTGLGLATVYGIVQQSGGTITARSEPGRGSTFTVRLPLVAPSATVPKAESSEPGVPCRKNATIMVVEDDDGVRRFTVRVLEGAGYAVLAASGGHAAIAAARTRPVDLLLTDVVMPAMRGHEVAARLTAARPEMRVLYMSGHTDKGIVHDGVLEPDVHYLAKPFTSESLLAAVDDALCEEEAGPGAVRGTRPKDS